MTVLGVEGPRIIHRDRYQLRQALGLLEAAARMGLSTTHYSATWAAIVPVREQRAVDDLREALHHVLQRTAALGAVLPEDEDG